WREAIFRHLRRFHRDPKKNLATYEGPALLPLRPGDPLVFCSRLPAAVMVSFDPNRPDFAPYGLTCVRWNPAPMRRPDHHNEVEINFLGTGWLTYLLGGRKVRFEAGRLSAFWAAIPHQIIDFGDETEYF